MVQLARKGQQPVREREVAAGTGVDGGGHPHAHSGAHEPVEQFVIARIRGYCKTARAVGALDGHEPPRPESLPVTDLRFECEAQFGAFGPVEHGALCVGEFHEDIITTSRPSLRGVPRLHPYTMGGTIPSRRR